MGFFSSGKSWSTQAHSTSSRRVRRESAEIIARHKRQNRKAQQAKARRKAHNKKFGRGPGIVCGWAADD
jgi:hypothetical protein